MHDSNNKTIVQSRLVTGITLVEVLIGMAIVCTLITLLFFVMQAWRESARRTQCANNFRQVAKAILDFHSANNGFPAGQTERFVSKETTPFYSAKYTDAPNHWSWSAQILPYLEKKSLYDMLDLDSPDSYMAVGNNREVSATVLPVYLCPSDPQGSELVWTSGSSPKPQIARTNICGVLTQMKLWNHNGYPIEFPQDAPNDQGYNSICYGVFGANGRCSVSDIKDGTSCTILVAEVAGGGEGTYCGRSWITTNLLSTYHGINGENSIIHNDYLNNEDGPASYHRHGCNFAMVDGRVSFISDSTDQEVINALTTRNGTEVDSAIVTAPP